MIRRALIFTAVLLGIVLAAASGGFLVIDQPRKSDVILVLAGETDRRLARALELFDQGYAPKIVLNVPTKAVIYRWTQPELAQKYVDTLAQAPSITICKIDGLSTKAEAKDTARCLNALGGRNVIVVTSDFHTRRALSVFMHEIPDYKFSVAAAYNPDEFGEPWWRHRQWAKVNFNEWLRLLWWEAIDRWN
jgi:uncharacterized SAM-binding protein YcdF (DUF218 family)